MGGKAPVDRSTCMNQLVLWLIVFFFRSVRLFVVGFGLYEWRNMVHTLVTWVLTGSAENVGRGNKPGNRQSHVFYYSKSSATQIILSVKCDIETSRHSVA